MATYIDLGTPASLSSTWVHPAISIEHGSHDELPFCSPYAATLNTPAHANFTGRDLCLNLTEVPYCRVRGSRSYIEEIDTCVYPFGWNMSISVGPEDDFLVAGLRARPLHGGGSVIPPASEGSRPGDYPPGGGPVDLARPVARGLKEEMGIDVPLSRLHPVAKASRLLYTFEAKESWVMGIHVSLGALGFTCESVLAARQHADDSWESALFFAGRQEMTSQLLGTFSCLPWGRRILLEGARLAGAEN